MTKDEALDLALDALEDRSSLMKWQKAITAIKQARLAPVQDSTCNETLRAQGKAYPRTCRKCGLGPCIGLANAALDKKAENARELGLDYEPADGTQVSKVWWDGEKLMAKPIPLEDIYQPAPVQEPVGEVCGYYERGFDVEKIRYGKLYNQDLPFGIKLYTTPPAAQRQWVGLTQQERKDIWREAIGWGDPSHDDIGLMIAIEAKLKEKNT